MKYPYISKRRRWLMLQNEAEDLYDTRHYYLEPWKRMPIDPTIEHVVTIEHRVETADDLQRVTCTCGLDRGWQMPIAAIQDARYHREHAASAKQEHGLDDTVPCIERKPTTDGWLYRWYCGSCFGGGNAPWLRIEEVALLGWIKHEAACAMEREAAARRSERRKRHA